MAIPEHMHVNQVNHRALQLAIMAIYGKHATEQIMYWGTRNAAEREGMLLDNMAPSSNVILFENAAEAVEHNGPGQVCKRDQDKMKIEKQNCPQTDQFGSILSI